jgi:hypothetical protein
LLSWLKSKEVKELEGKIKKIEEEAMRISMGSDISEANDYLRDQYAALPTPNIVREMRNRFRADTHVHFHSRNEFLYNFFSFPLNKFILSRYLSTNDPQFHFVHGNFKDLPSLNRTGISRDQLRIEIESHEPVEANIFISRHGPLSPLKEPGLKWIDESKAAEQIKARNALDQTGRDPVFSMEELRMNPHIIALSGLIKKEKIVIAIIKNEKTNEFLFTQRRKKEANLEWGFPAKKVNFDYRNVKKAIIAECEQETGVTPKPKYVIGTRVHPVEGIDLEYWYCTYIRGQAKVKDRNELKKVIWEKGPAIINKAIDLYEPLKSILNGKSD